MLQTMRWASAVAQDQDGSPPVVEDLGPAVGSSQAAPIIESGDALPQFEAGGPLPDSYPDIAHVPESCGARFVAAHADHSGVSSGKTSDRCPMATSIGCRISSAFESGDGDRPPAMNAWKSTRG